MKIVIEGIPYVLLKEEEYLKGTGHLKESASRALKSLTCTELDATKGLFTKLDTVTDIVLSTVADELKICKSIMSVAVKKLESNGIVEVASMGGKGTRITVLNEEFEKMLLKI